MIPGPLIQGPAPVGRRYGLLSAAAGPIDLPPHGEAGGVRYVDETCGVAHSWAITCEDGTPGGAEKQADPNNPTSEVSPFAVYASLECASVGYTSRELMDKVERRLIMGEQGAAEYALWTGLSDVDGSSLGIPNFSDDAVAVTVPDSGDLASVVSALEEWLYTTQGYGNVGYLHAPVSLAAWFGTNHLIRIDGNLAKTDYGTIIVFGGGYPGTGAGGEEPPVGGAYLVITGQTTVWRAATPFVYPAPQILNRATNQYHLLAEREYAIGFDCFAGRALFNPLGGS
jgi:hypothetical protein